MSTRKTSHSVSQSVSGGSLGEGLKETGTDPDDLFGKHTIAEVKVIQRTLRNDANTKQEELRQMYRERYRDLLQASASIISISQSSKHVIGALEETRDAIQSQQRPNFHAKHTTIKGNEASKDTNLSSLQVLSAHIKLLLDAPEHLWRLMEKKRYFTAAWLYLLSRVVHRALIREDEREEETWVGQGIDVLDQFPLVQRQWEHVSSFRQQIIVRARQSLQDYSATSEDTCATFLTLHVLEARPLTEALTTFLERRSKALDSLLSSATAPTNPSSPTLSRRRRDQSPPGSFTEKGVMVGKTTKTVKEYIALALECICKTIRTAHDVLEERDSKPSLIRQVLGHIQTDSDSSNPPSSSPDLALSTHDLLMSLPSSAHFLLLPRDLRSYRPYVDLESSSTHVKQDVLRHKIDEWFEKSTRALQSAAEQWLLGIQSVKNVWTIRLFGRTWISSSANLEEKKMSRLELSVDDTCRQRIIGLWEEALTDAKKTFEEKLSSIISSIGHDEKTATDASPITLLFKSPPLPTASQVGGATLDLSFQKYKGIFNKQILGRTSVLDDLLKAVEICAQTIYYDLNQVLTKSDVVSNTIIQELVEAYRPLSANLCSNIFEILHSQAEKMSINPQSNLDSLGLLGHLADEFASSSNFINHITCDSHVAAEFRVNCSLIYHSTIERWRESIVSSTIVRYKSSFRNTIGEKTCALPSSELTECLFSLAKALTSLGVPRDMARYLELANSTLRLFISHLLEEKMNYNGMQGLHDLILLKTLSGLFASSWNDVNSLLEGRIADIKREMNSNEAVLTDSELADRIAEYLARTQVLFATLLPRLTSVVSSQKSSSLLLPLGAPNLGRDIPAALDLAESPSRFGLLLVN
ncbi:Vps51/Vps67 domain-containing protein [Marasmius fiardii PR-910]|nr:Vps51/Vps67 domain-containing protein [Marasmius fiardii PR-910]